MRVLGLCSYPVESAATRYRLAQFIEPLAEKGIDLEMSSFLESRQFLNLYQGRSLFEKLFGITKPVLRRISEIPKIRGYDLLYVQREAMFFGPAVFEWIFQKFGNLPMILDLDDATYISYVSPTYGRIGSFFKFFGKTDKLIERADTVVCGNRFIAEYVEKKGTKTTIVPTVVDTEKFFPVEKNNDIPVLGWIGTHSTFPLLQSIFSVLQRLAQKHSFVLKIVGAGRENIEIEGVEVENLKWNLEREIADFQSLDIGLYPIAVSSSASDEWLLGKSGFKAIQYLSVGIPFVVTPIGVCAEIGEPNKTHFNATSADDWYNALDKLISDQSLRKKMGQSGRNVALRDFTVGLQCEKLEKVLRDVGEKIRH
jgi:glycosyltransferase involved in cell wall biosynthesis